MSPSRDIVLLLTHSGDYFTIDRVMEALSKKDAKPFRFDTDLFPMAVHLITYLDNHKLSYRIESGEQCIDSERVQSVWMRRLWQPQVSRKLNPQMQAACTRESLATLNGFFDSLRKASWVDNLHRIGKAEDKLRQLRVATRVGLRIPRTLVTNSPEEAREFFCILNGKMVAKMLTPLSTSMQGSSFFMYTNVVTAKDLLDAESLRYSPMVFQEQIPKRRELRAIFVAGKWFVGALDASKYEDMTLDWRRANLGDRAWTPHELPTEVSCKLHNLMAVFGLTFGVLDLIQTPDGEYVFLEVNPTGEWGMLERDLGFPIADAIADALLVK
jgi:MvdC family ATP-grasp ribosomal peptide maturase